MFRSYSLKRFDFLLVALIGSLNYCGLLAIRSAASELYDRQLTGIFIGFGLMLVVSLVDYHLILKIHWVLNAAAIALLAWSSTPVLPEEGHRDGFPSSGSPSSPPRRQKYC